LSIDLLRPPQEALKWREDMFDTFKTKTGIAGSEVHRFGTKNEALDFIVEFMKMERIADAPGSYALWADCPFLNGVDTNSLSKKIPGLRFEVTRQLAKDCRIGITQMEWGIANTGTLVQDATAVEQRLASALSWIHIALVATDRILADMPSVMTKIHPNQCGYIAMISAPSKTADIERVLAIGVHGPERLVIVCVDELGGMN
jgi:L-lactate dehydrogenase complex protein LldG